MTTQNLTKLLVRLFECKLKTYTQATLAAWSDELKDIPDKDLIIAFKKSIADTDSFPNPGKVRAYSKPDYKELANVTYDNIMNDIRTGIELTKEENKFIYSNGGSINDMRTVSNTFEQKRMKEDVINNYVKSLESKQNNKPKELGLGG